MKNKKFIIALIVLSLIITASACQNSGTSTAENISANEAITSSAKDTETSSSTAVKEGDTIPVLPSTEAATDIADGKSTERFAGDFAITNDAKSITRDDAKSTTTEVTDKTADSVDFAYEEPAEAIVATEPYEPSASTEPAEIIKEEPLEIVPDAGLLTTGEWRDNDNWGFFTNLVKNEKISFPSFGIDPRYRIKITATNEAGEPVPNAKAELFDENKHQKIWSAVTDHNGIAYLFAEPETENVSITVTNGENSQIIEPFSIKKQTSSNQSTSSAISQEMTITLAGEKNTYTDTEIMFILDTTGSMGDEMLFLQSEFSAITKEIGTQNTKYSVNFYRDEGDDYVTKCFDFSDNISELQKRLNDETADGGGDTPEAVAEILQQTISQGKWSENSVKLAFLIFDAPPHDGKEAILQKAISDAAEKGIRLVPVVSSNSERDTELFARAISIKTGGTYIFLTDDSGIGDSHLEPIIGDYKVEKLYDIIIRVIKEYQQ